MDDHHHNHLYWIIGGLAIFAAALLLGYMYLFVHFFDDIEEEFDSFADEEYATEEYVYEDDDYYYDEYSYNQPSSGALDECYADNSVPVIPIFGDIGWGLYETDVTVHGRAIEEMIHIINSDDTFAGAILTIDSVGGYPVASLRIAEAMQASEKPIVSVINDTAWSGGYVIAAGADQIFVHELSDLGNIGVTASYLSEARQNERAGLTYEELTSAPFKDSGSVAKVLTDEERALFQAQVDAAHDILVAKLARYREMSLSEMQFLSDGRSYLGTEAISNGLADQVGGVREALAWIESELGETTVISACHTPAL